METIRRPWPCVCTCAAPLPGHTGALESPAGWATLCPADQEQTPLLLIGSHCQRVCVALTPELMSLATSALESLLLALLLSLGAKHQSPGQTSRCLPQAYPQHWVPFLPCPPPVWPSPTQFRNHPAWHRPVFHVWLFQFSQEQMLLQAQRRVVVIWSKPFILQMRKRRLGKGKATHPTLNSPSEPTWFLAHTLPLGIWAGRWCHPAKVAGWWEAPQT